ncbi:hypothetical protein A3J90_00315 [candidate division WOR-1 bacterium RIFOXYC2_FULL_37_10]|uniref:Tetratricopeptide repeat protein n=1 Tax=candidate division WOR-1 bacterium RIFOXYB2_FULL_37_13 TaxID=1802579 RepID=A0A1F4SMN0_UNCSA|nr:MAG: hypothetical protein A2310_00200 [candidate division WOR-1 bacterium RIFOXYB2_FULL_37_13]OGC32577.1 MAG: hypothetical protein A3J90_00315 [candidate division WOR-1 bacterium RIFOXYC2_FULL_37_10]
MNAEQENLTKQLQKQPRNPMLIKNLGRHYLINGYFKQAREEYKLARLFSPHVVSAIMLDHEEAIFKNPSNIQARLSMISFCIDNQDIDAAIIEAEELLEIDPLNLQAYNLLGRIFIKQEKIDETMALLENALKLGIKDIAISEMLASVYLEKGRLHDAIKFYEELPSDKKTLRMLGELYLRTEDYEKAAEKYSLMYEDDPEVANEVITKLEELLLRKIDSIRIRELLAKTYCKSLKPEPAVKKLTEIFKIDPQKIDDIIHKLKDILKSYPTHPEATLALAEVLSHKGNYSEAVEEYYNLIKSKPDYTEKAMEGSKNIIKKFPGQFLARQFLIENYLKEENFTLAAKEIKALLQSYPDSAEWIIGKCKNLSKKNIELRECLGYVYLSKDDFFNANIEVEKILKLDGQSIQALLLQGEIFLKQKLCRKASETFNKALKMSPFNKTVHEKHRQARLKEIELEAEQIKKRITEDEWKISLHLELGKIYIDLGEKENAIRELQTASKDTQRASYVYFVLGGFYFDGGFYDQALESFRKSLQFASNDSEDQNKKTKFKTALTYEAQGNVRSAIKILEEILQEDIDYPDIKEKIQLLKRTNLGSLQNKCLVLTIKDLDNWDNKELIGMWGQELKKSMEKQTLSMSFGQNYNNSGLEFFIKGMHEAAEEEFSLAVQLDPQYIAGINNLAVAQLSNKKIPEALSNLRKAYEIEPASPIILNNLGLALLLNGATNEANHTLNRAIELNEMLPAVKINLADVFYALGKVKEAFDIYKSIGASEITYDIAKRRLLYKLP